MKPFIPQDLPIQNLDWKRLARLSDEAASAVYHYSGLLENMINPEILLAPLVRKEAELSSRIEGTQSTMSDVLEFESGKRFSDSQEKEIRGLQNYHKALKIAEGYLHDGRPFSLTLIKELHAVLMTGAVWDAPHTLPGEFRTDAVFIGPKGCGIENATYVPPEHFLIQGCLENWERYAQQSTDGKLITTGILHAQFEIIHPFMDGNGRIGRMLVPLYLHLSHALNRPMFYISEYFEQNRQEYYTRLNRITQQEDWQGWVEFFLTALQEQAKTNTAKVHKIVALYEEMKKKFQEAINSRYYVDALDCLFKRPIISSNLFIEKTAPGHGNTARNILKKLEEASILIKIEQGSGRTPSRYAFPSLLNIANGNKN